MKFKLEIDAVPAEWTGQEADLNYLGSSSVQVTAHPDQIYDLSYRVTWIHEGRAYEATVKRARIAGKLGT